MMNKYCIILDRMLVEAKLGWEKVFIIIFNRTKIYASQKIKVGDRC